MRFLPTAALAAALLFGSAAQAQSEDEAWIEDFMTGKVAADFGSTGVHAWPREEIEFGDLPRFVGYTVRVMQANGRARVGTVERADGKSVVLRSRMTGGYASFTLTAQQVDTVEIVSS